MEADGQNKNSFCLRRNEKPRMPASPQSAPRPRNTERERGATSWEARNQVSSMFAGASPEKYMHAYATLSRYCWFGWPPKTRNARSIRSCPHTGPSGMPVISGTETLTTLP